MTRSTMNRKKSGSSIKIDCVAAWMPVRCVWAIVFLLRSGWLPLPIVEDDGRLSKRRSIYRRFGAQPSFDCGHDPWAGPLNYYLRNGNAQREHLAQVASTYLIS